MENLVSISNQPIYDISFWKDRRVLVTGATGMVGSRLVDQLLLLGAYVVALVRDADPQSQLIRSGNINSISVVNGDLRDFDTLERAINQHEVSTVFHLAAQPIVGVAHRFPLQTFESNIRGTYNLLEACRIHRNIVDQIVIASSDKAYGQQPNLPYTEEMPVLGRQPYEVSKSCTDLIAQSYYHTYELPVAIARCGNIYGGGDLNWSRIVPGTTRSLLHGERPIIRSDGTFVRDYLYVKDVVGAYMSLVENLCTKDIGGQAFNFGPERALSVLEIVSLIQSMVGREELEPDIQDTAAGEIPSQYLSVEKAHEVLGWSHRYSINAGLRETIGWYREFFGIL